MTNAEREFLLEVLRFEEFGFAGIMTGRRFRRSVGERLVRQGYLEKRQLVVCGGDGFANEGYRQLESLLRAAHNRLRIVDRNPYGWWLGHEYADVMDELRKKWKDQ